MTHRLATRRSHRAHRAVQRMTRSMAPAAALLAALITLALPPTGARRGLRTAYAQNDPSLGIVTPIERDIFILETDADDERPILDFTSFDPGETLRTNASGAGLITWFYEGTESVLAQQSRLVLNDFGGDADGPYVIDVTLEAGQLLSGLGGLAAAPADDPAAQPGRFTVRTPDFAIHAQRGQFDVRVDDAGRTRVAVPFGRAEVTLAGDAGAAITLSAGQYLDSGMTAPATISGDGVTPAFDTACTTTASTNLVVRMFPSENSQRLGGVAAGQRLWVRSGTDGNLWLQVYYETDPLQTDLFNYGWVFGPATELDLVACGPVPRAALEAQLFGGLGIDESRDDLVGPSPSDAPPDPAPGTDADDPPDVAPGTDAGDVTDASAA